MLSQDSRSGERVLGWPGAPALGVVNVVPVKVWADSLQRKGAVEHQKKLKILFMRTLQIQLTFRH